MSIKSLSLRWFVKMTWFQVGHNVSQSQVDRDKLRVAQKTYRTSINHQKTKIVHKVSDSEIIQKDSGKGYNGSVSESSQQDSVSGLVTEIVSVLVSVGSLSLRYSPDTEN